MTQRGISPAGIVASARAALIVATTTLFCAVVPEPASAQQHLLKWNGGQAYEKAHRPRPIRREVIRVRERNANQDALVTARILQMLTMTSLAHRDHLCPTVIEGAVACTANGGMRVIRVDTKQR